MSNIDQALIGYVNFNLSYLLRHETFKNHDILAYYGAIEQNAIEHFDNTLRELEHFRTEYKKKDDDDDKDDKDDKDDEDDEKALLIILHTGGGSAEVVEKLVEITRHFYTTVDFLVPDCAMSAGTIWCMSGDKIYMNYSSSLGPIDPQVQSSNGKWIPALGYLDKFNELIEKSKKEQLSQAELILLSNLDLAELQRYQHAANLSTDLLKTWLVDYKFKNWTIHSDRSSKKGEEVTIREKKARAAEIANKLNDTKRWRSHNRYISLKTVQDYLELKVEDYSSNIELVDLINYNHNIILQFMQKTGFNRSIFRGSRYEN